MPLHKLDSRRAKVHRSYSVAEAAVLFGVHRNTVRAWIKAGLPAVRAAGTLLILGRDLRPFLESRRKLRRRTCGPGMIFCMRCREPRRPIPGSLGAVQVTATTANLGAYCQACGARMFRRIGLSNLAAAGFRAVAVTRADSDLADSAAPSVSRHQKTA